MGFTGENAVVDMARWRTETGWAALQPLAGRDSQGYCEFVGEQLALSLGLRLTKAIVVV